MTYERATQLRAMATALPEQSLVLETDAPDIPPHWIYQTAEQRAAGQPQGRNAPEQLPRIAQVLADLRGLPVSALAAISCGNARRCLPRLAQL